MSLPDSSSAVPAAAVREFAKAESADWKAGVPLAELLDRVNRVAGFFPGRDGPGAGDGRVKRTFTERSFRHYQTRGCIDPPEKDGGRALYDFRHFLQALLVRKLLWERVPADRIAALMARRSTGETRRLFFGGVEFVARSGSDGRKADARDSAAPGPAESWTRVRVADGVELHLRADLARLGPAESRRLLERLEAVLGRHRG